MSSRRSSRQVDSSSELFLECKAAFLSIYDDITDKIDSKKKLNNVLQQSGRNPTRAALDKYWPKGTDELSFDDFVDICRKEPVTTADDLMKAFRKIDLNGDGYISLDELYKIMNKQGESMSREEVRKMIDEVDDNKDGRLDYREFTNMIMKTAEESKKISMKVMEKKEKRKKRLERHHDEDIEQKEEDGQTNAPESARQSDSAEKSKQEDQSTKDSGRKDSPRVSPRSRSDSGSRPRSGSGSRARSDSSSKSVKKEAVLQETNRKDSFSKGSQKRDSNAKTDKPPLPDSPRHKDDKTKSAKQDKLATPKDSNGNSGATHQSHHTSFKIDLPLDSARSVAEDINYEDDFDIISTGRPTPRVNLGEKSAETPRTETKVEEDKKEESKETKSNTVKESKDGHSLGSQTSLRSDDVPRPSPRVRRESKAKSPGSKHKEGLPDARSLRDWQHYTSKGCFFYEEDEIVTHLFNLKLSQDSTVYLSAHPIDEPASLNLPGTEPVDTALFVFDSHGKVVAFTELRDVKGTYGIKCELSAGAYQVLPYTTGCRFRQRSEDHQDAIRESKLVKTKDDKVVITSAFRKALEDIFDLCDLDDNGTMSRDEFNWFNLRTSGEELGEDEWEVVEEKTVLENGEITKQGFIELNEMEAEDAQGDVEDLWITLSSMGMNKGLIMDEACPYRVDVYAEEFGRKKPSFKVTGIESLEKKEFSSEICQYMIEKAGEHTKIRSMKDLYKYIYKTDLRAAVIIDNRSRSNVSLEVDCSKSKNVISNRPDMDYTLEIDPQSTAIAHHLMPRNELNDWTVSCTETIHK